MPDGTNHEPGGVQGPLLVAHVILSKTLSLLSLRQLGTAGRLSETEPSRELSLAVGSLLHGPSSVTPGMKCAPQGDFCKGQLYGPSNIPPILTRCLVW